MPRTFWVYWLASTTSLFGSSLTRVALPLTAVTVLGASALQMGLLTAASYIAWLIIGLPAGALLSGRRMRKAQIQLDVLRGLALATIPIAYFADRLTFSHVLIVVLAVSFADVMFEVANMTYLPRIVERSELHARNSLVSGTAATTQLAGPSLAGLLVQLVGSVVTILIDVITYLVSAALIRALPEVETSADRTSDPLGRSIAEGWRYVVRHPIINPCMWSVTVINFVAGGHLTLFSLYLVRDLRVPVGGVGALLAVEGVGALIAASVCASMGRRFGTARSSVLATAIAIFGAALIPLGSGKGGWVTFALGSILFAFGVVLISTLTRTHRQLATPDPLLSRVLSTVRFVSWGAVPIGGLTTGVVASSWGNRPSLILLAAILGLSTVILLASPVRRLRDLE